MSRVIEEGSPKPTSDLKSQPSARKFSTTLKPPTSNHIPAAPGEGHPKLGYVWQSMIFIMSWLNPFAYVAYAYTGDNWYEILAAALFCFSSACVSLFFFASPSNASIESFNQVYFGVFIVFSIGGGVYGNLVSDPHGTYKKGFFYLCNIPFLLFCLYFWTMFRRKIGNFSRPSLKEYISKNIFLQGIGSLPPIIFFTTETLKCLLKEDHYHLTGDELRNVCGGVMYPQFCICIMFNLFLYAKIIFLPLTTTKVEMYELASFRKLLLKLKVQMVFIGLMVFANTLNFAILEEGPITRLNVYLILLVVLSFFVIVITEGISIIFTRRRGGERRESQVDRGDVEVVMENFEERVSSGLDAF
mmetsp:Transcript_13382/g.27314  ORF Transcript_13382/g.27314 Transcript_13382/m.27314 type:complete len:358 (-) Transcript_13382:71-1144(-)